MEVIAGKRTAWWVPVATHSHPRLRILALPHAGGWSSAFMGWRDHLPKGIELYVAQLPGRGTLLREEPLRTMLPVVAGLAHELQSLSSVPYVLVGHSFGSIVAFEMARYMRRMGLDTPQMMVVSARQAPQMPSRPPYVHHKTTEEMMEYLARIDGLPAAVVQRRDLLDLVIRTVRADFQVLETYAYRSDHTLSIPLTLASALDDPIVPPDLLYPWSIHTTTRFEMRWLTGGHFYIYQSDTARRLIRHILEVTTNTAHGDYIPLIAPRTAVPMA